MAALLKSRRSIPTTSTSSLISVIGIGIYIAVVYFILTQLLDRQQLFFPTLSTIAFPPLALAPFIVLALPMYNWLKLIVVAILTIILLPLVSMFDSAYLEIAIQIAIFAGLALGLNIVVGFAGLLDLGYVAFFAIGAYLWAMFTSPVDTYFNINGLLVSPQAFYGFLFFGIIAAGIGGTLIGLPVIRLRGDYLAIVTLGFVQIINTLAKNMGDFGDPPINFTNGPEGLNSVAAPIVPQAFRDIITGVANTFGISLNNPQPFALQLWYYFVALIVVGLIILIARRLENSPIGRAWTAIREDEVAAVAMGVPIVRMKMLAFMIGAAFAGAIGVIYAAKQTFVSPESFGLIQSISILAMVIVGGIGSIRGALFGACVVTILNLQVLKNLSLQISNLRNNNVVMPSALLIVLGFLIAAALLYWAYRIFRNAQREQGNSQTMGYLGAGAVGLVAIGVVIFAATAGDFPIRNWPTQLEPARYERLVFGLILIIMMIFRPSGLLPASRRRIAEEAARKGAKG
jgi:branched-chain amino acid transport system permease protein